MIMEQQHWLSALITLFIVVLALGMLISNFFTRQTIKTKQQIDMKQVFSIHSRELISFKVRPDTSSSYNDNKVVEFDPKEKLVVDFFQALSNHQPYQPQHDRGVAHWGLQIRTEARTITSWFYIPADKPGIVVGNIDSESGSVEFQSRELLRWYQKYGHHWDVGDYQKVQYTRVKPLVKAISPEKVTSFQIVPDVSESSTGEEGKDFTQETELVTEFLQALEDIQFAAPLYQELLEQWSVHIKTATTGVTIEFSIPADEPTLVVGLVDSEAGYSYFQSRQLYYWYQKYSHRWLTPEEP
jgi:hypothetical protein